MIAERQLRIWLAVAAGFLLFVYIFSGILLPFVLGMAVGYFFDPAADRLERLGLSRTLAAAALTVLFLVAVVVFVVLLAPLLQAQIIDFVARIPDYAAKLRALAAAFLNLVEARLSPQDLAGLRGALSNVAGDSIAWLVGMLKGLWSSGLAVFNLISLLVITPIVAFYMLRDWDRLVKVVDDLLPRRQADTIREQLRLIDETLAGFVRGQAIVCILLGIFYGVGLSLVGLDFGLLIGLGTGLISFVPYFGMLTGMVVGLGVASAQFDGWGPVAMVLAVFIVGQIVEGNFVTPKLVGERVGLHPVWMIFALLAGGVLFGFLGLLLSVPVAATIGVLVRFAMDHYRASPLYGDAGGEAGAAPGAPPAADE